MNTRRVLHILGAILWVLASAQLLPLLWCLDGSQPRAALGFVCGAGFSAALGGLFRALGHSRGELFRREGVLIVVGAWVLASATGAVPYFVSGALPGLDDALFESASGFTTTGATVLRDIEGTGRPLLFWRSFSQWLGGIGIVVLFVALLSELGPGARFLFKLEVPGPKAEVLHARVRDTALALARIYLVLTVAETALLWAAGLDGFDALTHTFSTVSTGGFSPYADSMGHFSPAVQCIVMVFMLGAGVNFSLYFTLARRRDLRVLRDRELIVYSLLAAGGTGAIALDLAWNGIGSGPGLLLDASFHTISILTTTGFSASDFSHWPGLAEAVLVAAMILGGCAGSTSGGAKIIRGIVGVRAALREVRLTYSPNSVVAIAVGRETVPEESVRSVVALLVLWMVAWAVGSVLLSVGDTDIVTAATASLATLSNVGPGLAAVGPFGDYAFFAPWQKLLMVGLMWLGRLEFFAVLALFQWRFWRR